MFFSKRTFDRDAEFITIGAIRVERFMRGRDGMSDA